MIILTWLFVFSSSAVAQMNTDLDGHMMGWWLGMGNELWMRFGIIIVILVIFGIVYMMKRK